MCSVGADADDSGFPGDSKVTDRDVIVAAREIESAILADPDVLISSAVEEGAVLLGAA